MDSLVPVSELERITRERIMSAVHHLANPAGSTIADIGNYLASTNQMSEEVQRILQELSNGIFQINEGGNSGVAQGQLIPNISATALPFLEAVGRNQIFGEQKMTSLDPVPEPERIAMERILSAIRHLAGSEIADIGNYLASTDQMSEEVYRILQKLSGGRFQINESGNYAIAQGRKRRRSHSVENPAMAQEPERKRLRLYSEDPIIVQEPEMEISQINPEDPATTREPGRRRRYRRRRRGKRGGGPRKRKRGRYSWKFLVKRWLFAEKKLKRYMSKVLAQPD